MSYPIDLDEYSDRDLKAELQRRRAADEKGLCTYCGRRKGLVPACKFPERHAVVRAKEQRAS